MVRLYQIYFIRSDGYSNTIPGSYFSHGMARVRAARLNSRKGQGRKIKGGVIMKVRYYVRPL